MLVFNKRRIGLAIIVIIIIGIIWVKINRQQLFYSLGLTANQKLIDYTINEHWLFAIIEEKEVIDQERYIYICKSDESLSKGKLVKSS